MNTILITGTAKCVNNLVEYNVFIWGAQELEQLQFVKPFKGIISGYDELWKVAKEICVNYFHVPNMDDGFYTQFLDHLTLL